MKFRANLMACGIIPVCLSACSTVPEARSADAAIPMPVQSETGLGTQTLAIGECGLFGWETSNDPDFVFFATADRALYMSGDGAVETLTPSEVFPAENYGAYQLRLGLGEPMIEGARYKGATMTDILADGFTRVRPLVILETCQMPTVAES